MEREEGMKLRYLWNKIDGTQWLRMVEVWRESTSWGENWAQVPLKWNPFLNSLVVQWLRLFILSAGGPGSITGRGTKIPQASQVGPKKGSFVYLSLSWHVRLDINPWRRKWQLAQYSCLENSMDRGAWRATAHGVSKSQTWLRD